MMTLSANIYLILGAYIVGSIPFGYWVAQWAGVRDIRRYGSGNIGATNVGRLLGIHFFLIILFLDACKAFVYMRFAVNMHGSPWMLMLCAYALLFGNTFSFLLAGIGGKGMATFVGIMLALNPILCMVLAITWIFILNAVKNVGIASVCTAFMAPWYALFFTNWYSFLFLISIAVWIMWRHQDNIRIYYRERR